MQTPYVFQKSIKALRFSAVHSLCERSSIWIQEVKMPSLSFLHGFFCTVRPAVVTEVHTESSQIFCRYISDEILHNRKIRTVFISETLLKNAEYFFLHRSSGTYFSEICQFAERSFWITFHTAKSSCEFQTDNGACYVLCIQNITFFFIYEKNTNKLYSILNFFYYTTS